MPILAMRYSFSSSRSSVFAAGLALRWRLAFLVWLQMKAIGAVNILH
jgi:uncharacterized membrane protein YciS (DUF1049 family)